MTYILSASLIVTVFAFAWLLDRKDRRHATQVADLCQRLQAPEVAIAQHAAYGPDEETPVTDRELEEEEREAIDRLERMEREAAPWLS